MKITNRQLRSIIKEELGPNRLFNELQERRRILLELADEEHESEMREFARSRSGRKMSQAGNKISSAGSSIFGIAEDQTGNMSRTLYTIAEFIGKLGDALSGLNSLEEGSQMSETLPTVSEFKKLIKEITRLERQ